MRFYPLKIFAEVATGERDELGNDITELKLISECTGRLSTWTAEEIALDTRNVTKTSRKIITEAKKSDVRKANYITLNDTGKENSYKVGDIKGTDDDRWRILVVTIYGE